MDLSLQRCLKALLRPVGRFCIRKGLTIRDLLEAGKLALVEGAELEIQRRGEKVTVSRLSIMTGLQRRDVIRLKDLPDDAPRPISLPAKVLAQWEQGSAWQSSKGKPKVLSYGGVQSEFSQLVRSVSGDLNPATLMFELERTGAVERTNRGIRLTKSYLDQGKDVEEALQLAAADSSDLLEAVQENLNTAHEIPNLHARTEFDNVFQDSRPAVREWLLNHGSEFHRKLREYLSQHDGDFAGESDGSSSVESASPKAGGVRVIVGTYSRIIDDGSPQ